MLPNKHNWCGGNYSDWLEVMLTDKCNGKCSWCVEKSGYHPEYHASTDELISAITGYRPSRIKTSDRVNVILLGGEPTLYKEIGILIEGIVKYASVYVTTNGGMITSEYVDEKLSLITGLNISIHHYDLRKNEDITGILLNQDTLESAIARCRYYNIGVRINCNIISGHIDSESKILDFIQWARESGADKVRFAELKIDENNFADLAKTMNYKYGLNDDPFICGCNKDVVINDMPVNFRQMCGLQTTKRAKPTNPKSINSKKVLYYDGVFYDGWQTTREEVDDVTEADIRKIIREELAQALKEGKNTDESNAPKTRKPDLNLGCCY